jgi:hypothetical protein
MYGVISSGRVEAATFSIIKENGVISSACHAQRD